MILNSDSHMRLRESAGYFEGSTKTADTKEGDNEVSLNLHIFYIIFLVLGKKGLRQR
jgi:hypothetical protein